MTRTILVAGTASHVGKSTIVAGLCRLLADSDVAVAPFKAQNMSNNARAVPKSSELHSNELHLSELHSSGLQSGGPHPGGGHGNELNPTESESETASRAESGSKSEPDSAGAFGEIGVSQFVQSRSATISPTTDNNPVLLKPHADEASQLVINGDVVATLAAGEYYAEYWDTARDAARRAHERLSKAYDVIVAEGAGSVGEPNLRDRDLANVETARFADASVVLVTDIERGGAFASVVGTLELAPEDVATRVDGIIINKFRGDRSILEPAIDELEERTGIPVLGVLPYDDPGLPEEDSVALPPVGERAVFGGDDGVPDEQSVTIGVPRLPRASNVTDLEPLAREPGVRVCYLPPESSLEGMDAVILSGTKNTVDDLRALDSSGMIAEIRTFDGPIVGLCGGYQMLGERILAADIEGTTDQSIVSGVGLLPVETTFSPEKHVESVNRTLDPTPVLGGVAGAVSGYEIHMGETIHTELETEKRSHPVGPTSAATDQVMGTYLHGLFENDIARRGFVDTVFKAAGRNQPTRATAQTESPGSNDSLKTEFSDGRATDPHTAAAKLVGENLDLAPLGLHVGGSS